MKITIPVTITLTTDQLLDILIESREKPDGAVVTLNAIQMQVEEPAKERNDEPAKAATYTPKMSPEDIELIRVLRKKYRVWSTTPVVLDECPLHGRTLFYELHRQQCVPCKRGTDVRNRNARDTQDKG